MLALLVLLTAIFGPGGVRCLAHPATIAAATAKVQADGHFQIEARFDLLAFALDDTTYRIGDGPMNALLDGPPEALQRQLANAEHRLRHDFEVSGGSGPGTLDAVLFPTVADVQAWCASGVKPRLPVMLPVIVQGHLPPDARSISFRFPEVLGTIVVTTEIPYQEPVSEPVEGGAFSTPVPLTAPMPAPPQSMASLPPEPPPGPVAPRKSQTHVTRPAPTPTRPTTTAHIAAVTKSISITKPLSVPPASTKPTVVAVKPPPRQNAKPAPVVTAPPTSRPVVRTVAPTPPLPVQTVPALPAASTRPPWIVVVFRYVKMGFTHILPQGLDHILFVLGLFLLSTRLKALLWQITAFTVAHSLTLALSLYGILRLPPTIVEPLIAASIAFVAIENLFTTELKPWRPFVVFGFGLVHGMGFAGALLDLGLPRHDFLTALVGFNTGVELGQLSVVALAFLAVGWLRSRPFYRRVVVIPGSLTIAVVAVFWTIQRIL